MQKLDPFCIACGDMQQCSCCGKQYWSSSNKQGTCHPAIPLPGVDPKELDVESQLSLHLCSWQHIHKNQNVQATQCPSVDGWINRMWSIHTIEYLCVCLHAHTCAQPCLTVIPWTIALQAPLFMGFSRQEYWSGLPFPSPGDLPNCGTEPSSLMSPALAGRFFATSAIWEACIHTTIFKQITSKDLLYRTENSTQYSVITLCRKRI